MRIKEIKIKDFKGISLLKFNPKKINLIIGKNNTGKTSVLEAIDLLFNSDEIEQRYPEHIPDIISVGSRYSELAANTDNKKIELWISKPDEIEVIYKFKNDLIDVLIKSLKRMVRDKKSEGEIEVTEEIKQELENRIDECITPELRLSISKKSIIVVKNKEDKKISYRLESEELSRISKVISEKLIKYMKDKPGLELDKKQTKLGGYELGLLRYVIFEYLVEYKRLTHRDSSKKRVILIKNLLGTGIELGEKTPDIENRILDMESIIKEHNLIKNLVNLDFDYVAFKDGYERKIIPFSFLGDGFKAIVGLLWYLSSKNIKNKIVLLDEPETHMHPGYIQELLKMLIKFSNELNIQFFISTHSGDVIDSLFNENFSPEEQKYLEKELLLLRMDKLDDHDISECLDYKKAKYTKEELLLDLRGI